jgi:hypothetical protein
MAAYLLPNDGSSQIVTFDLTISEGHEATAEVTTHPVEKGSNIADHVRPNPRNLNLELYVTNTPTTDIGRGSSERMELEIPRWEPPLSATPGSVYRELRGLIPLGQPRSVTIRALTFPDVFDRVKEVYTTLLDLWSRGVDMSIVSSLGTYETMVLTSVGVPRTEKGGATFNISSTQVKTVTTATVSAPAPSEKRGAPNQAKGGQSTKPVGGKDAAKTTSMAVKALQAVGAL